ncbi:DNA helicase-2 / ATP-dependent DNA helicase PcrA [Streptomyces sp. DvalAA-14]|uniref:UvrD-helicase domain-containing protein n=1 Tax=unclassified Streptomyces TaxID=2593676 RepID=UPI00081B1BC7|nr:UvrD-helicase domain-containing protein [Streptomyces sp. DvalAA-14]MYS23592.1 UvrD-helicase domain-containing protein [Streptomyces sp. SID4948]SCE35814.1 DNA helicase-2 / ATP-dependent DNA helicase PcrA [Streptomyces sp. DvalAA-14]
MAEAVLDRLTREQLIAAGTAVPRLYIEAAPGSGKTTVSAYRFGAQRFALASDPRAVVAVSFTRSATAELRARVRATWGRAAINPPHRIVTLDTVIYDLLAHLLHTKALQWPGGHTDLEVLDTWKAHYATRYTAREPVVELKDRQIVTAHTYRHTKGNHLAQPDFDAAVNDGRCTHDNVRAILEQALADSEISDCLIDYFATTTRVLIVDEIFDANSLDLAVVELAAQAGLHVTVVGDPWQALYGFRGARPDLVPVLIDRAGMVTLQLTESFRWRTPGQRLLAAALRRSESTTVPSAALDGVDVVLAREWKPLWNTHPRVLPLAFRSATGNTQEAASTLLLNQLTRSAFGEHATYAADAAATLRLDEDARARLEPRLDAILAQLADEEDLAGALAVLTAAIATESSVTIPGRHPQHIQRLQQLRTRLLHPFDDLVLGLTTHQAKGREWDSVAVRLEASDTRALYSGLDRDNEDHRKLYVALTRARCRSLAV